MKNYGLIIPKIETREEGAEHILGSERLPLPIINPSGNHLPYLPDKEPQSKNGLETFGCTVWATLNAIEGLIFEMTGVRVNYADRYVAIYAKNKGILNPNVGADPHKIAELIRLTCGLIKEDRLPFSDVITAEEFYAEPVNWVELIKEGPAWYEEWELKHYWVFQGGTPKEKRAKIVDALTKGIVCASVRAWKSNGSKYYKEVGEQDNHWTLIANAPEGKYDNFDSYDGFFKELEPDYDFTIAKVYALRKLTEQEKKAKTSLLEAMVAGLKLIVAFLTGQIKKKAEETPKTPAPEKPPVVSPPAPKVKDKAYFQAYTRSYCKDIGLSPEMTEKLMLTIQCESGWNPEARNKNKDGTIDWGIAQLNSYWYIGAGRPCPSVEVAINDPEFCLRLMANQFKAGRAVDWICYRKLTN